MTFTPLLDGLLIRKISLASALGFLVLTGTAYGEKFTDDLISEKAGASGFAPEWGDDAGASWTKTVGSGVVHKAVAGAIDFILPCKAFKLHPAFTVSLDVRNDAPAVGAHWAGIAFHIQDEKNYYVFRLTVAGAIARYQVLKCVNGELKSIAPRTTPYTEVEAQDGAYTLQVDAKEGGAYTYTIRSNGKTLVELAGVSDTLGTPYKGGYAGLYAGSQRSTLTHFVLETPSEVTDLTK